MLVLLLVIYQLWISGYRLLLKSVGVTVYSIYVPNIHCYFYERSYTRTHTHTVSFLVINTFNIEFLHHYLLFI